MTIRYNKDYFFTNVIVYHSIKWGYHRERRVMWGMVTPNIENFNKILSKIKCK
jgi:hypothetical protein